MINIKGLEQLKKYCKEYKNIEGYEKALNDKSDTRYHCHHRKETDENLSMNELKALGLYYDVPASDLIMLTAREHAQLHSLAKGKNIYNTEEEVKEAKKKYYEDNKEHFLEYQKEYRETHKEYRKEYNSRPEVKAARAKQKREYNSRPEVKERINKWQREHYDPEKNHQHYEDNKDELLKKQRSYDANHKEEKKVYLKVYMWGKNHNFPKEDVKFPKGWSKENIDLYFSIVYNKK